MLPPSKVYMEQLKSGCGDPSESDILHTLRWSSRLRVSTYVNWIKVCSTVRTMEGQIIRCKQIVASCANLMGSNVSLHDSLNP